MHVRDIDVIDRRNYLANDKFFPLYCVSFYMVQSFICSAHVNGESKYIKFVHRYIENPFIYNSATKQTIFHYLYNSAYLLKLQVTIYIKEKHYTNIFIFI